MVATRGFPLRPPYSASKGAVNALSRQMAADYGPHNIRVNTIIIGLVITELSSGVAGTPELAAGSVGLQFIPASGRPPTSRASRCTWARTRSTFITASELVVDAGSTVKGPMLAASFELGCEMTAQNNTAS